eukprot:7383104-Prymnesium_polylepis.1
MLPHERMGCAHFCRLDCRSRRRDPAFAHDAIAHDGQSGALVVLVVRDQPPGELAKRLRRARQREAPARKLCLTACERRAEA